MILVMALIVFYLLRRRKRISGQHGQQQSEIEMKADNTSLQVVKSQSSADTGDSERSDKDSESEFANEGATAEGAVTRAGTTQYPSD